MNLNRPLSLSIAACAALFATPAFGQLRICNYNILAGITGNTNAGLNTVLQAMGSDNTAGFSKPIDILLLQETVSQSTSTQQVVDILNTIYGAGTYARGNIDAATSGGGRTGFVYRTSSVTLVNEVAAGTVDSANGAARQQVRGQFRPVGYGSSADFYIYNGHYKASSGASNEDRRLGEADVIRKNADALGQGARVIFGGDFNTYKSTEPMLTGSGTLLGITSAGNAQGHDPLNRPGSWNNNAAFVDIASQAPDTNPPSGFVSGGLNSRFDMQYPTDEMLSGEGVSYIPGSYHTFMNNGSTPINSAIDVAANNALPGLPNRSAVLSALTTASDHLPLMVDYQIPAKMSLSVGTVASQVIVGASVNVNATITNSASVVSALGADELDYSGSGSGKLSGAISGTANALASGNVHAMTLNTATPGAAVGTVSVSSSSQGAASASLSASVSTTVLAHANPSFSLPTDSNSQSIDFGVYANGSGAHSQAFNIANIADASGFTAGLKLVSVNGVGSTSVLTTSASPFASQAANGSQSFSASLATTGYGTFSATYTFATADQDLPGAIARENLTLTLNGVVALGGDANIDGFVDTSDFNLLAGNFGVASPNWQSGDFNRDGAVDSLDFSTLTANYGQHVVMGGPVLGSVVPEPGSMGIVAAVVCLASRRRKSA